MELHTLLKNKKMVLLILLIIGAIVSDNSYAWTKERKQKDRAKRDFYQADINGDNRLSPAEWKRRGNFSRLDKNSDGALILNEVRAMYKGHNIRNYQWPPENMAKREIEIDETVQRDRVGKDALDDETICGIASLKRCDIQDRINRGLIPTGTGPRFPEKTNCPGIDDYWAMDYSHKRRKTTFHSGIDIPVPWGTPMRAIAAGSVVGRYPADNSKRGNEIILRHSPEQTGIPIWTYSTYGHLDVLPELQIGQKIVMGEIIGPTGNSGISGMGAKGSGQSKHRRPAIHFAILYSSTNKYFQGRTMIIPQGGYWLDPIAFYRQKKPFDSASIKALDENEKSVFIPVLLEDGTTIPPDTKIIWPYTCQQE